MLRIVYFGTAQFAVAPLKALLADRSRFEVVAVVSQPDKPAGRHAEAAASPVARAAREAGVTLFQPAKMKTPETLETLREYKADVFIVAAYGRIIPRAILDLPPKGCLNLHGSLLPAHRGASPIQAAIAAGDAVTGVTLMGMDEEVDHGPTFATVETAIEPTDTYATLEAKLADAGAELLLKYLEAIADGLLESVPQDHRRATYTGIIDKRDGFIDWRDRADVIERRRRAFTPWPGIYAVWKRNGTPLRLKLLDVAVTDGQGGTLGTVFRTADGYPAVITDKDALKLITVQPEGKKPLDGKTLLNGYQDLIGAILENEETPA